MLPEYIDCDKSNIPFDAILKSLLTTDTNGNIAIRVTESTDSGAPFFDCDNSAISFEQAVRRAVVLVNELPALNLAVAQ